MIPPGEAGMVPFIMAADLLCLTSLCRWTVQNSHDQMKIWTRADRTSQTMKPGGSRFFFLIDHLPL